MYLKVCFEVTVSPLECLGAVPFVAEAASSAFLRYLILSGTAGSTPAAWELATR
jgi:hypothetical protein